MGTTIEQGEISVVNASFNVKRVIDTDNLMYLKNLLCTKSWLEDFQLLFNNPSDCINSIKWYPFPISKFARVGRYNNPIILGKEYQLDVMAKYIETINKSARLCELTINRYYNNFMDYEPYTKVELYVPYFGIIPLPTNEVMGQTLYLDIAVDFDTGIGTLYITCEGKVIMTNSTKLGIDIPIGASNYNQVVKDNMANMIKTIAGIGAMAVGGALGKTSGALLTAKGLSMAVSSGVDIMTNSIRYTRGSLTGGTDMLASPTSVYAIITRPNAVPIDDYEYRHLKGKPLGEIRVLSLMEGFTQVDQIHLVNMPNALDEEMKEIESLLRQGVEF